VSENTEARERRIIDKTDQAVKMLPEFKEKLEQSHLISSKTFKLLHRSKKRTLPFLDEGQCKAQKEKGRNSD
jgi:hypothetical protein